jgi:hypothetical protein
VDHAAPEAALRDHVLLGHERRVLAQRVLVLRALDQLELDQLALDQPALVERVRDRLPLVPQVFGRLVREVVDRVLLGELTDQRAVLTAH